jgi:N-acetylglucosamine kinase-like BadF-type ATPase
MVQPIVSLGVDLGGTWVRLEGLDARKRRVRSLKAPAPAVKDFPAFLTRTLRRWRERPLFLTVGSRGVWSTGERTRMRKALIPFASRVTVMSDVEAAWHAAFEKTGRGVMVIAGTGSIAYASDGRRGARAGGLGPQRGDEGSGFWIGQRWLNRKPRSYSTPEVRRMARVAVRVLSSASRGNLPARTLVREAQRHLAQIAVEAARRMHFRGTVPISWGGRLLQERGFRSGFFQALRRQKIRFRPVVPRKDCAAAMARVSS